MNKNIVRDSSAVIIGNHNKQIIQNINIYRGKKLKSNNVTIKLKVNVARLISFAKNNYANVSWAKIFQSYDENDLPNKADVVIKEIFQSNPKKLYPEIFKIIKQMYPNLNEDSLKELREIFKLFGIDYELI